MHSEGILAGELKHGPLALVDKEMPVIMIIMRDACYNKCQNALQQVTARSVSPGIMGQIGTQWMMIYWQMADLCLCPRQGRPIILCCQDDPEMSQIAYQTIELPQTVDCLQGILSVIPLQLLSFHLAVLRGYDVSFKKNTHFFIYLFLLVTSLIANVRKEADHINHNWLCLRSTSTSRKCTSIQKA